MNDKKRFRCEVPIDNHHDYYLVECDPTDLGGKISVRLWSRGSFEVSIELSYNDAEALSKALMAAAVA